MLECRKKWWELVVHYIAVMLITCLIGGSVSALFDYIFITQSENKIKLIETFDFLTSMVTYGFFYFIFSHLFFLFSIAILFTHFRMKKIVSAISLSFIGLILGVFLGYGITDFYDTYNFPENEYKNIFVFGIMLFAYPLVCLMVEKLTKTRQKIKK